MGQKGADIDTYTALMTDFFALAGFTKPFSKPELWLNTFSRVLDKIFMKNLLWVGGLCSLPVHVSRLDRFLPSSQGNLAEPASGNEERYRYCLI